MSLTDAQIRSLTRRDRSYRRADARGLYLEVSPTGSRLWRYKYRYLGKEKRLALGSYPAVKLAEARQKRDAARAALDAGTDPALERKREKAMRSLASGNTFSAVADEYIRKREKEGLAEATLVKQRWFLALLEPTIGRVALNDVEPLLLFSALKRLDAKGVHETSMKVRGFASRVFRFGVQTGRCSSDPAALLRGSLTAPRVKHHAAITDADRLRDFLHAADGYGSPVTRFALKVLPHVFLRPGELRFARWSDIDLQKAIWTIPAERAKARRVHHVPLSKQVTKLLQEAHVLTGPEGYVFPSSHTRRSPMSENTLNGALRRLGFSQDEATAHGFRATASTLLNESGHFSPDAIERALAHAPRNAVRAAYHRGEHWEERVRMAQWWSDLLCRLQSPE